MSTNKIFIQFYLKKKKEDEEIYLFNFIKKKKREDEKIYIIMDVKSLLIKELKRFYLSFEDIGEFFHNDLYLILYNKKFICKIFFIKLKW